MYIPDCQWETYHHNTARNGYCSLTSAAQCCAFKESRKINAVPEITKDVANWIKSMLDPLVIHMKDQEMTTQPSWVQSVKLLWDELDQNPVSCAESKWMITDDFITMLKHLDLQVNIWGAPIAIEGGNGMLCGLDTIIQGKDSKMALGATVADLLKAFDGDAINVVQSKSHYFVCGDTSLNESTFRMLSSLGPKWSQITTYDNSDVIYQRSIQDKGVLALVQARHQKINDEEDKRANEIFTDSTIDDNHVCVTVNSIHLTAKMLRSLPTSKFYYLNFDDD